MNAGASKRDAWPEAVVPADWSPDVRQAWTQSWADHPHRDQALRHLRGWTGPELAALLDPAAPGVSFSALFASKRGAPLAADARAVLDEQIQRQRTLATLHRQAAIEAGDLWRDDLCNILRSQMDPEHPWRVGRFDAIVERQGRSHLIVYRLPPAAAGTEAWASVTDEQARVQAHHEGLLARAAGIQLASWAVMSLDLDRWTLQTSSIAWDEALAQRLTEVGDLHWAQLMSGAPAPTPASRMPWEGGATEEVDWEHLATRFLALSLLSKGADNLRSQINENLENTLSPGLLPVDVEHMPVGPAKLKFHREFQADKVLGTVRSLLSQAGHDDEATAKVLENPNLWTPAAYDFDQVVDLVNMHLGVDILKDDRFKEAQKTPAAPNVKTLLALIREMDVQKTVDYRTLIDPAASSVRLELPGGTVPGPLAKAREQVTQKISRRLTQLARELAHEYPTHVAQAIAESKADPEAVPRRRRVSGTP